jgi:hypothetical protein
LRFGGPIAVAIELSSGPVISLLQKYDFVVIHPNNPSTLAKYREAFTPSGAKDDPTDAELAVDLFCATRTASSHCALRARICVRWEHWWSGAGPSLAPRLMVAFGEQRERFSSAAELQKYSGIAPVTERSGKKEWVHWRLHCPTFLRQAFVEWAEQTINKSYWTGAF